MLQDLAFHSPSHGLLSLPEMVGELATYIDAMQDHHYTLIIGTDSKGHEGQVDFVTAVVVHREGLGGRYFWLKTTGLLVYSLRDKIYKETLLSLELAKDLVPALHDRLCPEDYNYKLEIHVDVGLVGDTREVIREVVGMVSGSGY